MPEKNPTTKTVRRYLCCYGNCDVRLPMGETYIVGAPRKGGAMRYCSADHAALHLLKWVYVADDKRARLIAAAPDLLAALKMMLPLAEAYLSGAPSHPDNAMLEDARAAIAKAQG